MLIYASVLILYDSGVDSLASLPEFLAMVTLLTSVSGTTSSVRYHHFFKSHQNSFHVVLFIHHQNALALSALGVVFPAQNSVTLLGVYVANQPSFGITLSSFVLIFDVPVLCAKLIPGKVNLLNHDGGRLSGSDRIFQMRYATHDGITCVCCSVVFL